ncbi:MAG TPA: hypothetical protein DCM02_08570 [Flavobacterium sp.]|nr:hypothetical protein [Flavobacterium sp.]
MDKKKPWRHGGFCKPAPYKTKIIRVPEDLVNTIKNNINQWHYNSFPEQFVKKHKLPLIELIYKFLDETKLDKNGVRQDGIKKLIKWLDTQ